jgi:hypothetical protein
MTGVAIIKTAGTAATTNNRRRTATTRPRNSQSHISAEASNEIKLSDR